MQRERYNEEKQFFIPTMRLFEQSEKCSGLDIFNSVVINLNFSTPNLYTIGQIILNNVKLCIFDDLFAYFVCSEYFILAY